MVRHYRGFARNVPAYQRLPKAIEMSSKAARHNPYRSAEYVISAHRLAQLPADEGIEVAFAGRSNSGKSSAINALTEQKALARTSKTPGRTQQIVIFDIQPGRHCRSPGYGYAKVPARLRAHWKTVRQRYFGHANHSAGSAVDGHPPPCAPMCR
jgi:GTP-binding protein